MFKTFKRSATDWKSFARARRITVDTHLSEAQAREACRVWNANRTARQIRNGTKLEFTSH